MSTTDLFARLANLTSYRRTIAIAKPDDINQEHPGPDGRPRFAIREGAETTSIEIRALTARERDQVDRIMDSVIAPQIFKDEMDESGRIKARTPIGWDEDDPAYQKKRRLAVEEQFAHICILGCQALAESTEGTNTSTKAENLRAAIDAKIISFIAQSIWSLGYAGGDHADFFSKAASSSSPS